LSAASWLWRFSWESWWVDKRYKKGANTKNAASSHDDGGSTQPTAMATAMLPSDMDYKDQGRDYESVMKPPEVSYVTDL
jgi:hypothetical protein